MYDKNVKNYNIVFFYKKMQLIFNGVNMLSNCMNVSRNGCFAMNGDCLFFNF